MFVRGILYGGAGVRSYPIWTDLVLLIEGSKFAFKNSIYDLSWCIIQCRTGRLDRMLSYRKWRETKQQPSRNRSGHQISCCLVSLHFLCAILSSRPVYLSQEKCNCWHPIRIRSVHCKGKVCIWRKPRSLACCSSSPLFCRPPSLGPSLTHPWSSSSSARPTNQLCVNNRGGK